MIFCGSMPKRQSVVCGMKGEKIVRCWRSADIYHQTDGLKNIETNPASRCLIEDEIIGYEIEEGLHPD